ncbi:MAG TPA: GTP-binding protein [Polyangia bacterium]|nr:GTP-binding protein [Polyangia bacterium]
MKTDAKTTTDADAVPKPPLVLLTGFLGAGKTTTLNRVLGHQLRLRVGVIINELGRIDIDTRLVKSRAGDVMELAGGCVCHEVRVQSELWAAIEEVKRRSRPDVVVLETTGIAEPWSILSGLEELGDAAPAVAAGVVCVVDAEAGAGQLARHEEARAQVEAADRILLTKLDLAAGDAVVALHRELGRRNPAAERASFPAGDEGTAALVPWLLAVRAAPRAARRDRHAHAHGQLTVVTFADPEPLLAEPLLAVIEGLGAALVRAKGFIHLAGDDRRGFLERAGERTALRPGEPWGPEPRATELVLIGDGLEGDAIRRQLWACRARR